ncbi:pyridoxamine 5'-phosphate oxidase family protein [Arthrobacter echini]|uniref:Pyridoxamine 5'-phosphate oxidase family protein n=1 Tax=Arthrobacter echini TaxID=1529066 RepID=A0A4V3Z603_9MICC|nr:pyridoxamine 5'-phosphate oxidase family protein [Arthrobacter echini]THJ67469.1 pyridoxamine 5'-phosphate oxidase family protein [Arthrobacter echini]
MTSTTNNDAYWDTPGALRASDALTPSECWALATTQSTGRLGFFREGLLDIFPVSYLVLDERLYFRTSPDGVIATSDLSRVAFQVDQVNQQARTGWSVLANGPATPVEDEALLTRLWGRTMDEPLAPGRRDRFYSLAPVRLRGRRVGTAR